MKRLIFTIAILWFGCLGALAQTPMEWLERMARAERTVALEGVRVTQFFLPEPLPPVREYIVRLGVRYRVEYLQPTPRRGEVLIDDGLQRFHYLPRQKKVQILPSDQPQTLRRRQDMLDRLRRRELLLTVRDAEPIAGRHSVLLEATTADRKPLRRWWIDREHGVILRMEELTPRGEVRMRSEYIRLTAPTEVPPERFEPRFPRQAVQQNILPPARVFNSVSDAQPFVPFTIRQPRELPRGFRLLEVRVRPVRMRPLVSLHYTDEVSSLLLFQTRLPLRPDAPFLRTLAPLSTRVDVWSEGDVNFALLGNAPPAAFDQMRRALR